MVPPDVVEARFALAARVADELLTSSSPLAVGVVGSTASGRCSADSDLDLVAIVAAAAGPEVTSRRIGDVRVDVEWLSRDRALADTAGEGWAWELRKAARLGHGVALYDPANLFPLLAERSRAMRPDLVRYAAELRAAEALLGAIEAGAGTARARGEALRGVIDTLAMLRLLALPRRYQKAKWTLDDLIDQGEAALAETILEAYRVQFPDTRAAADTVAAATTLIAAVLRHVGAPDGATLVAMGYAPDYLAASYVARTLADAGDLAQAGRSAEAQYVAGFAARLAAGLLGPAGGSDLTGRIEAAGLQAPYAACFGDGPVSARSLAAARAAAGRSAAWLHAQSVVAEAVPA